MPLRRAIRFCLLKKFKCKFVGCGQATDKIACLRNAPFEKIYEHQGTVGYYLAGYRSLASPWNLRPSPKDKFLKASPDNLAVSGKFAQVPLLMGDMKDEGPLFSLLAGLNTTTEQEVKDYFKTIWWPNFPDEELKELLRLYPQDPRQGSPFDTGYGNTLIGPQYKRIAAIVGDYSFESQRRQLFGLYKAPIWAYRTQVSLPLPLIDNTFLGGLLGLTGLTDIPLLGSFHSFDTTFYLFETLPAALSNNVKNIMGTWISFVYNQDPNQHGLKLPYWPQYDQNAKKMFLFKETGPNVITDTYRSEQMDYINKIRDHIRI